ncbi:MAG: universal stress protein [Dysgonomonas sp.]|nr:universal stress protein [Dysgonomonas sp.]
MNDKLVTLAIHKSAKAHILKRVLEDRGIEVFLEDVDKTSSPDQESSGIYVRIKQSDLSDALYIIEGDKLFNYSDQQISLIDDGRKRILVAVDFSDYSLKACEVAFKIAKNMDAKVKILNVFNQIRYPLSFPFADTLREGENEDLLNKTRRQMLDLCNLIDQKIANKEFPSINYSYSIREGITEEEIGTFVEEYKPMLLVIGTKGKGNNKTGSIGNVASDVIEMVNVPVLAIPGNFNLADDQTYHIAYLTNFLKADLESFNTFVNIVKPYDKTKVTLVHVNLINKKGDKWTEIELLGMKEYFASQYPALNVDYKLIDTVDLMDGISDFIAKSDTQIVALNSRKRNIFSRIFLPSVSRKIILKSDVALLVLRQ